MMGQLVNYSGLRCYIRLMPERIHKQKKSLENSYGQICSFQVSLSFPVFALVMPEYRSINGPVPADLRHPDELFDISHLYG